MAKSSGLGVGQLIRVSHFCIYAFQQLLFIKQFFCHHFHPLSENQCQAISFAGEVINCGSAPGTLSTIELPI